MTQSNSSEPVPFMLLLQAGTDDAPVLSGQGGTAPAATGTAADGSVQGAPVQPQGGLSQMLIFIVPVLLFFVFITFMGSRRDKKRRDQLSKITKHDRVRTRGGIIGSVVEAKDDQLVIKVDESRDTRITLDRQYVDAILETSGSED